MPRPEILAVRSTRASAPGHYVDLTLPEVPEGASVIGGFYYVMDADPESDPASPWYQQWGDYPVEWQNPPYHHRYDRSIIRYSAECQAQGRPASVTTGFSFKVSDITTLPDREIIYATDYYHPASAPNDLVVNSPNCFSGTPYPSYAYYQVNFPPEAEGEKGWFDADTEFYDPGGWKATRQILKMFSHHNCRGAPSLTLRLWHRGVTWKKAYRIFWAMIVTGVRWEATADPGVQGSVLPIVSNEHYPFNEWDESQQSAQQVRRETQVDNLLRWTPLTGKGLHVQVHSAPGGEGDNVRFEQELNHVTNTHLWTRRLRSGFSEPPNEYYRMVGEEANTKYSMDVGGIVEVYTKNGIAYFQERASHKRDRVYTDALLGPDPISGYVNRGEFGEDLTNWYPLQLPVSTCFRHYPLADYGDGVHFSYHPLHRNVFAAYSDDEGQLIVTYSDGRASHTENQGGANVTTVNSPYALNHPTIVDTNHNCQRPHVLIPPSGDVFVVYYRRPEETANHQICLAASFDGGATWLPSVVLYEGYHLASAELATQGYITLMLQNRDGVWHSATVSPEPSDPVGWHRTIPFATPLVGHKTPASLTQLANGEWWFTFNTDAHSVSFVRSTDFSYETGESAWTEPSPVVPLDGISDRTSFIHASRRLDGRPLIVCALFSVVRAPGYEWFSMWRVTMAQVADDGSVTWSPHQGARPSSWTEYLSDFAQCCIKQSPIGDWAMLTASRPFYDAQYPTGRRAGWLLCDDLDANGYAPEGWRAVTNAPYTPPA